MLYSANCEKCGPVEIEKPMTAVFPLRHLCGGKLTREFDTPTVHYHAGGFFSTDVTRLRNMIGGERYDKLTADIADIERRAKTGNLTPYERSLEGD